MVQQVLDRYGAATPYLALDVPEANRTIYAFDVMSPNKTSQRSLVGELRQELSGLSGVGKVAIGGGGFGSGGSESGGGFSGL